MKTIKLSDIIIKKSFADSHPSDKKVEKYRDEYTNTHKQSKRIVLDKNNVLVDGYIQYLILKENNVNEAQYLRKSNKPRAYRDKTTTYIYGKHINNMSGKEYVWRIPDSWCKFKKDIKVGDMIFCNTRIGVAPVIVTKIITTDECPVDFRVKRVAHPGIRREA
jgi:hypothetical protein